MAQCPQCQRELNPQPGRCVCGYYFSKFKWSPLINVTSPHEIVLENLLQAFDIPVKLIRHDVPQIPVSFGPMAEITIMVPETLLEQAKDILKPVETDN